MHKFPFVFLCLLSLSTSARADSFRDFFGSRFENRSTAPAISATPAPNTDVVRRWNKIAIDATGLDHTPVAPGENRVFGHQLGPGRASRAMAIVHIAMFDAVDAMDRDFKSYTGVKQRKGPVSLNAAVAQAAHDSLIALFPSQSPTFDSALTNELLRVHDKRMRVNGVDLGRRAAAAILALRNGDGSEINEPHLGVNYTTSDAAGHWRQDPISQLPVALGAHWGECRTFVLQSGQQFRVAPPPDMTSDAYATAYREVQLMGSDGVTPPTLRTPEQTFIGVFWAYDGTPSLCAPPRLYNQIAVHISDQMHIGVVDLARLLALVNTAMADTGIAVWESKYYYDFWRPVTAIRESDATTGPSGTGDGNLQTFGDPNFMPLGAPASNLNGPNFTPPFPSYPSGHGAFGGALFETLRRFFGTDNIPFTFVSDEFNGATKDANGNARPYMPRSFSNLSQAEEENGQSRIYLGIHFAFDKTAAIAQGREVADYVFENAFTPAH
ncbi:MAG: hypothetical protein QOG48_1823 [Verrucomicrobiota bacterium]